jgi:predicted kinase
MRLKERNFMFLLQMAGFPGSGKSTLAKEISKNMDIVVIDRDVIKSSMLESGVDSDVINNASYHVAFSLCKYYLSINKSVIIDTPCYYEETLENGIKIADQYNAEYKYIECRVEDFNEVSNRLKSRERSISQIESAEEDRFLGAIDRSKKPNDKSYLTVDSSLPIEAYFQKVIDYLQQ